MPEQQAPQAQAVLDKETEAIVFGYPLVLMDVTRQVMTSVPNVDEAHHKAPINQLVHLRELPDASFTDVVSPNVDTLYSIAFLDLKKEPLILSLPEMGGRYYLMELLDAWTNVFAAPGTRTTGNHATHIAIVGPSWRGRIPSGLQVIEAPTNLVWLIGRTQTSGKNDFDAVHALQDRYRLIPLSAWGTRYVPETNGSKSAVDTTTPPPEQVAKMSGKEFFARLNALMRDNPPAPADAEVLKSFADLGIAPGRSFDASSVGAPILASADAAVHEALERIQAESVKHEGRKSNGWQLLTDVGRYGTEYLWRAAVALVGLGANLPDDALYPRALADSEGRPLTGEGRYEIRFAADGLPPVHAFWSITMYDERQFLVENPIDRYALGDRDPLIVGPDGSLTIYVQSTSPGPEREANWLPSPTGSFNLMMRLYWPKKEILDGTWHMPPIVRVG